MGDDNKNPTRGGLVAGVALLLVAFALMGLSIPSGVQREYVGISLADGRPCRGTVWMPGGSPKAVMLIGHGVSSNQGVMATTAKAFAAQGYVAVAFDFFGHGRSREGFDWKGNPEQVNAWIAWARESYPGLPLGYLGHSMGGFAGAEALADNPAADAFVALGAIPRRFPTVKTLVAAGQFEELFTPEKAAAEAAGKAEVLISPFSNHAGETWDPVLLRDIVAWVDKTLGLQPVNGFPWGRWALLLLATALGSGGALLLAAGITALFKGATHPVTPPVYARSWSLNPYRLTARLLGWRGPVARPQTDSSARALGLGVLYSMVTIVALSFLLDAHIFTSNLNHPARCMMWALVSLVLLGPAWLDAIALERSGITSCRQRLAVAALTRAVPLLVLCVALRLLNPGLAFLGMLLGIFAFVATMLAMVHTLATRSAGDYRAGVVASAVIFAWVLTFWFPMTW